MWKFLLSALAGFTLGDGLFFAEIPWQVILYYASASLLFIVGLVCFLEAIFNKSEWAASWNFSDRNLLFNVSFVSAVMLLFASYSYYYNVQNSAWQLPTQWIKQPLDITGTIVSLPQPTEFSTRFQFATDTIGNQPNQKLLLLNWYRKPHATLPVIQAGEHWHFVVKLKPPIGLHNFLGFDYEKWLDTQNIQATGSISTGDRIVSAGNYFDFNLTVLRWRQAMAAFIQSHIQNPSLCSLLIGLSVGSTSYISKQDWYTLQQTGTSHLLAISGLHVGLLAMIGYSITSFLWRCFPRGLLLWPAQRVGLVGSMICAICYATFTGLAYSAQRAVIMLFFMLLSQLCLREISVWLRLALAAFFVLCLSPDALYSLSFILSFSAIASIAYSMQGRHEKLPTRLSKLRAGLYLQLALELGMLSANLWFFQQCCWAAPAANTFAIPWVELFIVPLLVLTTLCWALHLTVIAVGLLHLTAWLFQPLWWWLTYLQQHTNVLQLGVGYQYNLLFLLAAALICLSLRGMPARYMGFLCLLPVIWPDLKRPLPGQMQVLVLDVGQGLSVLIKTQQHNLLYDAGPRYPDGLDSGQQVVVPYLLNQHIKQLDRIMISHGDNDHSGGAHSLIAQGRVKVLITSVPAKFPETQAVTCYAGMQWEWEGVQFKVLSPALGEPYQDNNSSCVLRVQAQGWSILLPGDIEKEREAWLVNKYGAALHSTILVAAHHGNKTSSTQAFAEAVHPDIVLYATGYLNRYGFPDQHVKLRFQNLGAHDFNTAYQGAIEIKSRNKGNLIP